MTETQRTREAAMKLTRAEFYKLKTEQQGVIAQAFGISGRIYDDKQRAMIWRAVQKQKREDDAFWNRLSR